MKILKRTKGLLRFRTTEGTIALKDGVNELTNKEFKLIKAHPMYEAMVKTSGLVLVAEDTAKIPSKMKNEAREVENLANSNEDTVDLSDIETLVEDIETLVEIAENEANSNEDTVDLSDIDLAAQDKKTLVEIAANLAIKTKGQNKEQIIELIKAKQ